MKCIKTGLNFRLDNDTDETYHGDLFYVAKLDCLLIRGIARDTTIGTDCHVKLVQVGDCYQINWCSHSFNEMLNDYYYLVFPTQSIILMKTVIIDDTRFFQ